jgi:4-aminobutyrate aminotransferase-like enzyme
MTLWNRSIVTALPRLGVNVKKGSNKNKNSRAVGNLMMRRWNSSTTSTPGQHLSPVWSHLTTIQPVRGKGIYLYDAEGTKFSDFTSGIGVSKNRLLNFILVK